MNLGNYRGHKFHFFKISKKQTFPENFESHLKQPLEKYHIRQSSRRLFCWYFRVYTMTFELTMNFDLLFEASGYARPNILYTSRY